MSSQPKEVAQLAVDAQKLLSMSHGFEPPHPALALARGLVRILSPVVPPLVAHMLAGGQ